MDKVYVVTQFRFTDGNFGDLESLPCKLIGVFTTPEKAQQAIESVEMPVYNAQFGSAKERCLVRMVFVDAL